MTKKNTTIANGLIKNFDNTSAPQHPRCCYAKVFGNDNRWATCFITSGDGSETALSPAQVTEISKDFGAARRGRMDTGQVWGKILTMLTKACKPNPETDQASNPQAERVLNQLSGLLNKGYVDPTVHTLFFKGRRAGSNDTMVTIS